MPQPSPWVERFLGAFGAPNARVLDLACGNGRHIALARKAGYRVTGVDRDVAEARSRYAGDDAVMLVETDLENGPPFPFPPGSLDGVIVTNYLWRPLLPSIVEAVAPHGALIYETFRLGNERFGKPSNPNFLLRPGELLEAVRGKLLAAAFEEATLVNPSRAVQRICAVGPNHPWIDLPPQL